MAPGTLLPASVSFTVTLTRYALLFLAQGSPPPYYLLLLKFYHLIQGVSGMEKVVWRSGKLPAAALPRCLPSGRPSFILGLSVFEVSFLMLIPCGPLTPS